MQCHTDADSLHSSSTVHAFSSGVLIQALLSRAANYAYTPVEVPKPWELENTFGMLKPCFKNSHKMTTNKECGENIYHLPEKLSLTNLILISGTQTEKQNSGLWPSIMFSLNSPRTHMKSMWYSWRFKMMQLPLGFVEWQFYS